MAGDLSSEEIRDLTASILKKLSAIAIGRRGAPIPDYLESNPDMLEKLDECEEGAMINALVSTEARICYAEEHIAYPTFAGLLELDSPEKIWVFVLPEARICYAAKAAGKDAYPGYEDLLKIGGLRETILLVNEYARECYKNTGWCVPFARLLQFSRDDLESILTQDNIRKMTEYAPKDHEGKPAFDWLLEYLKIQEPSPLVKGAGGMNAADTAEGERHRAIQAAASSGSGAGAAAGPESSAAIPDKDVTPVVTNTPGLGPVAETAQQQQRG